MSKTTAETNALEMSDEDFMKNPPQFDQTDSSDDGAAGVDDEDHDESDADDSDDNDDSTQDADNTDDNVATSKEDDDGADDSGEDDDSSGDGSDSDDLSDGDGESKEPDETQHKDSQSTEGELTSEQYAEVGRQIMGEFKANGTTMKVKSAEDAIQLMQMGANYHKKMTGLKPSLKTLKLLENNDLLDPEKLNYLIDLSQKKPEAIKQLLKESKLDPLSIDLEEENNYKPHNRTVSDTEMALDEVLDSISSTASYDRTLNVLSNEWDDASRRSIANEPQLIKVINNHMEHGIFDQVISAVNYERSLGKLTGISDLEAYQRVGAYMNENNMFTNSADKQQNTNKQDRQDPQSQNTTNTQQNDERKNRKKAASPSRQGPAAVKKDDDYSPLSMSDEEFAKLNNLSL